MESKREIKAEIEAYYNQGVEADRLSQGVFQLEEARTREILQRLLTGRSYRILDIGGGAGAYSFWLAEMGHVVHLRDPVEFNVTAARVWARASNKGPASIDFGDARDLQFPDEHFDMVLMLGPLYHLDKEEDRLRSLREAQRVLVKGGILVTAIISRFASLLDGYFSHHMRDSEYIKMLDQDLATGSHINRLGRPEYFTTAYFQRPADHREELRRSGFHRESLIAVEAFAWLLPDFHEQWSNASARARMLDYIRRVEDEPEMLGMSAHILGISVKGD